MLTRRHLLATTLALTATAALGQSARKITIGALRFTSSGPVFLAAGRGYFADEGLTPDIAFFQDAPTIAAATASGEVTFGVTALTAAFYNLASQGRLSIIAGQASEKKGVPGNLILVRTQVYEAGHDRLDTLFGMTFGLTQLGSPSHYQLGQLADASGVALADVPVQTFQTLPNLIAALKAGHADWAIIAPPIATDLIAMGAVRSIGPYSDHGTFQFGAAFAANDLLTAEPDLARAFLRAYRKGLADYSAIVTDPTSPEALSAATVVGHQVYPDLPEDDAATKVLSSALYVDPTGQVDQADIARQITWYAANDLVKTPPDAAAILRLDLMD